MRQSRLHVLAKRPKTTHLDRQLADRVHRILDCCHDRTNAACSTQVVSIRRCVSFATRPTVGDIQSRGSALVMSIIPVGVLQPDVEARRDYSEKCALHRIHDQLLSLLVFDVFADRAKFLDERADLGSREAEAIIDGIPCVVEDRVQSDEAVDDHVAGRRIGRLSCAAAFAAVDRHLAVRVVEELLA